MVKKDKKSKTAEQKARVAAKQNKKAAQKEKRVKSKGNEDSDAENIDLESVLEDFARQVIGSCSSAAHSYCLVASEIPEGHRNTLRTAFSALIGDADRLAFKFERIVSFWWRVLQWGSCHFL